MLGLYEPNSRGSMKKVEEMFKRGASMTSGTASYQNSFMETSTISRYRHKN